MMKKAGSGFGPLSISISQRHGSSDPDPYQNVTDPQHWKKIFIDTQHRPKSLDPVVYRYCVPLVLCMFLRLLDPDSFVRGMDPDPLVRGTDPDLLVGGSDLDPLVRGMDPNPSIIKQK